MNDTDVGTDRLATHAAECDACRSLPLPLGHLTTLLNASTVDIDPALLSRRVLVQLRPQLQRRATLALWRQVAVRVLLSLLPLPAVLACDAYVLSVAYDAVSALLPTTVAAFLVLSYAAFLVLLFASTYAAIPLLVARAGQRAPVEA